DGLLHSHHVDRDKLDPVHQETADQRGSISVRQVDPALRRCADPADGVLLAELSRWAPSKIVVSSRLLPRDLCEYGRDDLPLPGVHYVPLYGLRIDDALTLWEALGVHGQKAQMAAFLDQVGCHALALEVLAGHIARYYPARGDFDAWYAAEG